MTPFPKPPIPSNADLRHFEDMPVDVIALRQSTLAAEGDFSANWLAVILWCAAWHQIPAGSLPKEDKSLAHLSGLGRDLRTWKKYRAGALRGWKEHSDGRLYHDFLTKKVLEAIKKSRAGKKNAEARWSQSSDNKRKTKSRRKNLAENSQETGNATAMLRSDQIRSDQNLIDRERARTGANEPENPAAQVIAALDRVIVETFGSELARPWPHATDAEFARRFLEDHGADLDLLTEVFRTVSANFKATNRGPPGSVKVFEKWVKAAVLAKLRPDAKTTGNGVTINGLTGEIDRGKRSYPPSRSAHAALAEGAAIAVARRASRSLQK